MKFSIRGFFSKCEKICRKLWMFFTSNNEIVNRKLNILCGAKTIMT